MKIARVQDLKERNGTKVVADGEDIALFKIGKEVFAISNVCPHQHFSKLHEGIVEGCTVTCPMHGWTFDVATGKSTNTSGHVQTFHVCIENDAVILTNEY